MRIFNFLKGKLHRQIYLTIVLSIAAIMIASGLFFAAVERGDREDPFKIIAQLVAVSLNEADRTAAQQQALLENMARDNRVSLALFKPNGTQIASVGSFRGKPDLDELRDEEFLDWQFDKRSGSFVMRLADGRYFAASSPGLQRRPPLFGVLTYLVLMALVIGLAAWPFARRLTGRLTRLQDGVEAIGAGDLSVRVRVEGRDEIAALATSFNHSASRVEKLVDAHRMLLANASHELRTPLARIRMGLELMQNDPTGSRRDAIKADMDELDGLIDEILLMSRLDTGTKPTFELDLDLTGLIAEECARYPDCALDGQAAPITGDRRLLTRLFRNILENAHLHGKPPVDITIEDAGERRIITIADHGAGIARDRRERLFEPFARGADRQNVEGYGLGLALVRQIAEAHGGTAAFVEPEPGHGATLRITLAANP